MKKTLIWEQYQKELQLLAVLMLFVGLTMPKLNNGSPALNFVFNGIQKQYSMGHAEELLGEELYSKSYRQKINNLDLPKAVESIVNHKLPMKYKYFAPAVRDAVLKEAARHRLDPFFLLAVIYGESTFNPEIIGRFGEIGLMQIKPSTAKWIDKKFGLSIYENADTLRDPAKNIALGAQYMAYLREKFDSNGRLYVTAYNMGPRNVRRALKKNIIPKEYAGHIMNKYKVLYNIAANEREIAGPFDMF